MQYTATRNSKEKVNSSYAIAKGLSKDGGLYLPTEIPTLTKDDFAALKNAKGPRIQLLGKTYHAVFKPGAKEGFELNQDDMILTAKDETRIQLVFEKQAKLMLEELLNQKRGKLDLIMDDYRLNHPEIAIKKMKGKWGSCTPAQAKIVMNLMLIHLPVKCIEYVLIHEYMHMICPNHSKRFYELIENVMPDYRRYMKMLKEE